MKEVLEMMYYEATIRDERVRENLVQCIKMLGCKPLLFDDRVSVILDERDERLIELFEQFPFHEIRHFSF